MELSGATTANWVAKTANLLTDELGRPDRVGLLLPLHWQAVVALLAAVTVEADVLLAGGVDDLSGCPVAFAPAGLTGAVLAAGVPEVLGLSTDPMGRSAGDVAPGALDVAEEVPGHGDHYSGPRPGDPRLHLAAGTTAAGAEPAAGADITAADRVLTTQPLTGADGLATLLGALRAGAALVLAPDPAVDLAGIAAAERVTRVAGATVAGVAHVGAPTGR